MKPAKIILIIVATLFISSKNDAQNINWKSMKKDTKHILNINVGWDYALVYGIGYAYKLNTKMPIVLNAEFSLPSGKTMFDDFKTKIGGKVRLYEMKNFHLSANIYGVFRRYENDFVQLANFGNDFSAIVGYYKPKWFIATEIGFDKAVVSHFKHSELYKETIYPNVKDGWYQPATGGNFNYGLQTGISFKQSDITLKIGNVHTQDFKTTPLIPYYFQLGFNYKI